MKTERKEIRIVIKPKTQNETKDQSTAIDFPPHQDDRQPIDVGKHPRFSSH